MVRSFLLCKSGFLFFRVFLSYAPPCRQTDHLPAHKIAGQQIGIKPQQLFNMDAAWQLLPALTGMLLMLSLMNASGLTALLVRLLSPLTAILNLPQEVAPMLILRPMTGSGSLAALQEIFAQYGADSRVGRIASVLMGSSETIFYTMSVYLGAAGVKKLPGALGVSLLSYLTCAWVCGLIC